MTGLVQMNNLHGEFSEAARLASEHVELLESIGDPALIVGLLTVPIVAKWDAGEMAEAMRLSQWQSIYRVAIRRWETSLSGHRWRSCLPYAPLRGAVWESPDGSKISTALSKSPVV